MPIFTKKAREMKKVLCDGKDSTREVISWNEFKVFRTKCLKKREDLCKFLKVHFGSDDPSEKEK